MNKLIQFALAGIVETLKQRRFIKQRERAAMHNLRMASIHAQIARLQKEVR